MHSCGLFVDAWSCHVVGVFNTRYVTRKEKIDGAPFYVYKTPMKVRVHLTIGEKLKAETQRYARSVEMDFAELVSHLLREEIANPTIGQKKKQIAPDVSDQGPPSTGSTSRYRRRNPSGVALIAEDPSGTPSDYLSVRSKK